LPELGHTFSGACRDLEDLKPGFELSGLRATFVYVEGEIGQQVDLINQ
jgi:hypothetical protein